MSSKAAGKLVLVGTPIGNLSDMSERAAEVIRSCGVVMAEDTRRTARLLPERRGLFSYHDHNAGGRIPQILDFLADGQDVALVSDAGMPGISDPAYRAVRAAIEAGYVIEAVPGPSAVICAVAASGLPTDRFAFEGFLPRKSGARQARLAEMSSYDGSIVYYIGPHHLLRYLQDIREVMGDRPVCVARELTKMHEEFVRGSIEEVADHFSTGKVRGEITLVVGGVALKSDFFD